MEAHKPTSPADEPKSSVNTVIPCAYGAHRLGLWGYIWHQKEEVESWIHIANARIDDDDAHWHGPVALCDDKEVQDLVDEVDLKQACIAGMREQAAKQASRLEHCQRWYSARFERLSDYARTLPEEHQKAIFNILANGTADWMETPSYQGMLNRYAHERDVFESKADNLGAALGRMVYATRHSDDPGIKKTREMALSLIRKLGIASPLRMSDAPAPPVNTIPATITADQAHAMGAKGAEPTEEERLLFEAWMAGHCWAVTGAWDGKTYISDSEKGKGGWPDPQTMMTRQLWAAWRDRAALTAPATPDTAMDDSSDACRSESNAAPSTDNSLNQEALP